LKIPRLSLADKQQIPQIGLGTWKVKDKTQFMAGFNVAIDAGYRHFDTAQAYDNEQFLGEAWHNSGLKRGELFITTNIAVKHFGYNRAISNFDDSLKRLQTDYVDLLLLHFPLPLLRKKTWQAVEAIHAAGSAKSIGVSNYMIHHLEEMKNYAQVLPVVNQVELHVFLQQPELVKYCQEHHIVIEAYSPLAHAQVMNDPLVTAIAEKYHKTYAQIMLRYLIELNLVVLPKSVTPSRVQENIDIFSFKLDDEDMAILAGLDRNLRTCWSPVHVP